MRGRSTAVLGCLAAMLLPAAPVRAQEGADFNVEFVRNIQLDFHAIGSKLIGKHLYVTGEHLLSVFDVSDPVNPSRVGIFPLGYQWQNEDVSTNGKILLFSESTPGDFLHVWDVSDPANPHEISRVLFAGNHTSECLFDCTWSYGSEGDIVDLRDPAAPVLAGNWLEAVDVTGGVHDVNEVRPGLVAVATYASDFVLLDTTDPQKPRVVASGVHPEPESYILHQVTWPNAGADRLVLAAGEGGDGPLLSYVAGGTPEAPTFTLAGRYTTGNTYGHWFDLHPRFRDGGLVAHAWYGQGTRILRVDPDGAITEAGYWNPNVAAPQGTLPLSTVWAAQWITDDVFYAIDNERGIDVLKYVGEIPAAPVTAQAPRLPAALPPCSEPAPAVPVRERRGLRFPGASRVQLWLHTRSGRRALRSVNGSLVATARLRKGIIEARVRSAAGVRRVALERAARTLRLGPALEVTGRCDALSGAALSAPAFAGSGLRLRYELRGPVAGVSIDLLSGGRVLDTLAGPGTEGTHSLRIRGGSVRRGRRLQLRVTAPGSRPIVLGATRL